MVRPTAWFEMDAWEGSTLRTAHNAYYPSPAKGASFKFQTTRISRRISCSLSLFVSSFVCVCHSFQAESDASSSEMSDDALQRLVSRLVEVGGVGDDADTTSEFQVNPKFA